VNTVIKFLEISGDFFDYGNKASRDQWSFCEYGNKASRDQ
jgi:hypothetical protein